MDARSWEEAGLYDPSSPRAAERLALLEYLTERGATLAQMVDAHATGTLPGLAGDLVTQGTPMATVTEIAARSGQPLPLVFHALLAAGIPAQADTEVPESVSVFLDAFEQGAAVMGEEATLAFIRVLGAAANTIAEGAVALFFSELGPGTVREGANELARAKLAEAATTAFTRVPDVVAGMVLHAFERAQRRVQAARPYPWPGEGATDDDEEGGPTEVVALGFVDLVGSTAWAQSLPLRDQNLALTRFESAAWSSAVLAGGRVVKTIGDEVFFVAPSPDAACRIAIEVCQAAAADHVLPPAGARWESARPLHARATTLGRRSTSSPASSRPPHPAKSSSPRRPPRGFRLCSGPSRRSMPRTSAASTSRSLCSMWSIAPQVADHFWPSSSRC